MHDDKNDDIFNRADCLPALFTIRDPLYKRHAARIVENQLRCFKVDTVLRPVDFVFRRIPFDAHLYLQYSTYDCVKSCGGNERCPPCDRATMLDRKSVV